MSDYGTNPPPPPPPPGGGYGAPPPMGAGQVDHPKGTLILILGILGIVCCSPAGVVAFFMGNTALKEIDANPTYYRNRGMVQAGRILGIISIVVLVLSIIWVFFLGGLAVLNGGSSSY